MRGFIAGLSLVASLCPAGPAQANAAVPIVQRSLPTPIASAAVAPTGQPAMSRTSSLVAVPSGQALIASMRSAIRKAGSVHFDFLDRAHPPSFALVETSIFGDASWLGGNLLHEESMIVRQGLQKGAQPYLDERIELKIAGRHEAWRPGRLSWTCERLRHVHVLTTLVAMKPQIVKVMSVKLSTLKGRAVWRVRARGSMPGVSSSTLSPIDYIILAENDLPLRVTVTIPGAGRRRSEILSERYTLWGTRVGVSLPAKCRK